MKRRLVFCLVLVGCMIASALAADPAIKKAAWTAGYEPAHGDILFQSLHENEVITMIEGATGSPFSTAPS